MTLEAALKRYLADVTPYQEALYPEERAAQCKHADRAPGLVLPRGPDAELIANYRDTRLNSLGRRGQSINTNTVRL